MVQNGRRGYCAKYIQLIQCVYGQKVALVHYILVYCTGRTFCPYPLDQLYVCGAKSSDLPFCVLIYINLCSQGEFILRGLARTQHLPFVAIMAVGGNCACFRLYKSGLLPLPLHPPSPQIRGLLGCVGNGRF